MILTRQTLGYNAEWVERKTTRYKTQRKTTRRGAAAVPVDTTAALSQGAVHLVPTKIPKIQGYEIVTYMDKHDAADALMYDFVEIDPRTLGIGLFHVTGADAMSYLALASLKGYMHSSVVRSPLPVKVLGGVNKFLHDTWGGKVQVNGTFCVLDLDRNSMSCCALGQVPLVFYSRSREKAFYVRPKYPPLGSMDAAAFREVKEFKFVIDKHDWVVLFNSLGSADPGGAQMVMMLQRLLAASPEMSCANFLKLLLSTRANQPKSPLALVGLVQREQHAIQRIYESSARMRKCRFCDHVNESYTDVCTVCGSPLGRISLRIETRQDEILCPACRCPVRKGSRGCRRCETVFCTLCLERLPVKGHRVCKECSDMHGGIVNP